MTMQRIDGVSGRQSRNQMAKFGGGNMAAPTKQRTPPYSFAMDT